jgi:SAM-dependent methyltransferase
MTCRSLDLGCGSNVRGPGDWERWGIDVAMGAHSNIVAADLTFDPIPFPDGHFQRVSAWDFLEHLPMRISVMDPNGRGRTINVMVNLFNEVWRVLSPGGIFETFTPHGPNWQEVFRDPTHVSFWVEQTWEYFAHPGEMVGLTRRYGLTADFHMARKEWRGAHLYVELRKE